MKRCRLMSKMQCDESVNARMQECKNEEWNKEALVNMRGRGV